MSPPSLSPGRRGLEEHVVEARRRRLPRVVRLGDSRCSRDHVMPAGGADPDPCVRQQLVQAGLGDALENEDRLLIAEEDLVSLQAGTFGSNGGPPPAGAPPPGASPRAAERRPQPGRRKPHALFASTPPARPTRELSPARRRSRSAASASPAGRGREWGAPRAAPARVRPSPRAARGTERAARPGPRRCGPRG